MRERSAPDDAIDLAAFGERFRQSCAWRAEIQRERKVPFHGGKALDEFRNHPVKQKRLGAKQERPPEAGGEQLAVE